MGFLDRLASFENLADGLEYDSRKY